ncbi:hypothetical protein NL676_015027 [Syzygium grande]|nr:hypothetical protein NL676_015027 [Syzygium grande]
MAQQSVSDLNRNASAQEKVKSDHRTTRQRIRGIAKQFDRSDEGMQMKVRPTAMASGSAQETNAGATTTRRRQGIGSKRGGGGGGGGKELPRTPSVCPSVCLREATQRWNERRGHSQLP